MKVDVAKLSEDKEVAFFEEWDAERFDLNAPGLRHSAPVVVEAFVKRNSRVVEARISMKSTVSLRCARCFKEFENSDVKAFKFVYPIDLSRRIISLDDHVREELILNYPQKVLCRADCRGLCVSCGADLNEEGCRCQKGVR